MPEEYRIWKDKVDAAEAKKREGAEASKSAAIAIHTPATGQPAWDAAPLLPTTAVASQPRVTTTETQQPQSARSKPPPKTAPPLELVEYATVAEAQAAFKALLLACDVPHAMKFKDVQDLCEGDARWFALRSGGDRKQALAEYQVLYYAYYTEDMFI